MFNVSTTEEWLHAERERPPPRGARCNRQESEPRDALTQMLRRLLSVDLMLVVWSLIQILTRH